MFTTKQIQTLINLMTTQRFADWYTKGRFDQWITVRTKNIMLQRFREGGSSMKLFAFKQDEKKFWERDKPVRVHRADKSPNFGVRQVAVFATMAEAQAWVVAQDGPSRNAAVDPLTISMRGSPEALPLPTQP